MPELTLRVMRSQEWTAARTVSIEAFGGDESIGTLLDVLRASWSWDDSLAFVAARPSIEGAGSVGDEIVAFVLFTPSFVDAADRVVPVLVLSPLGVRTDLQRQGIGSALVRFAL